MHYRDHVLVHHVVKPEGKVYCQTELVWKKKSISKKLDLKIDVIAKPVFS